MKKYALIKRNKFAPNESDRRVLVAHSMSFHDAKEMRGWLLDARPTDTARTAIRFDVVADFSTAQELSDVERDAVEQVRKTLKGMVERGSETLGEKATLYTQEAITGITKLLHRGAKQ